MNPATIVFALCLPFMAGIFGLSKKKTPTELLTRASLRGDIPGAKAALENGANVHGGKLEKAEGYGFKHTTPLQIACTNKDLPLMRLLIEHGADVNARGGEIAGVIPLQNAIAKTAVEQNKFEEPAILAKAAQRRLEAVKILVEHGADVNRQGRIGGTPLASAAGDGSLEIVRFLLSKGATPNGEGTMDQPLAEVARRKNPKGAEVAAALIAKGAKVSAVVPPTMETPLHIAAMYGNTAVVKTLLSSGAKPNTRDQFDSSPLHAAAAANHLEIATLLKSNGADLKAVDSDGRTPQARALTEEMRNLLKP